MEKIVFSALFSLTCFFLTTTHSFAAPSDLVFDDKRIKVVNFLVAPEGIEFVVQKLRGNKEVNMTPNSGPECVNQFIVPFDADNFDVKAAVILTAKMKNHRIMLEYDIESTDCWVEAISVGIAK